MFSSKTLARKGLMQIYVRNWVTILFLQVLICTHRVLLILLNENWLSFRYTEISDMSCYLMLFIYIGDGGEQYRLLYFNHLKITHNSQ